MSSNRLSSTTSVRPKVADRKWFIDMQLSKGERLTIVTASINNRTVVSETSASTNKEGSVVPVGWTDQSVVDNVRGADDDRLLAKRSWDIACQPLKQLPMNMIFSWMAGNTFSLMSIMIVVMLFMKPIQVII